MFLSISLLPLVKNSYQQPEEKIKVTPEHQDQAALHLDAYLLPVCDELTHFSGMLRLPWLPTRDVT